MLPPSHSPTHAQFIEEHVDFNAELLINEDVSPLTVSQHIGKHAKLYNVKVSCRRFSFWMNLAYLCSIFKWNGSLLHPIAGLK